MKELKDIVLKKGDIVYFADGDRYITSFGLDNNTLDNLVEEKNNRVVKIERPVEYETIYEAPKPILDKEEKEYLETVLKPFKNRVEYIIKFRSHSEEIVDVVLKDKDKLCFPTFAKGTMYKGMELNKEYTLKELGLFE